MAELDKGRVDFGERAAPALPEETNIDRIRRRARELWEAEGRPEGREREYWLRAEREILGPERLG